MIFSSKIKLWQGLFLSFFKVNALIFGDQLKVETAFLFLNHVKAQKESARHYTSFLTALLAIEPVDVPCKTDSLFLSA